MHTNTSTQLRTDSVRSSLQRLCQERPAYRQLTEVFAPLLEHAETLRADLTPTCPALPPHGETFKAQGIPLLTGNDLTTWNQPLDQSLARMAPVLETLLERPDLEALLRDQMERTGLTPAHLVLPLLQGDEPALNRLATALEQGRDEPAIDPGRLGFFLHHVLSPVLSAAAATLPEPETWGDWKEPICPICGSLPAFATLSPREPVHTEQIVSGGGRKHLHCGLCGHHWRIRRDACPGCGQADSEQRELLFARDAARERIEICHSCNGYALCVDLREFDPVPALETVPLALLHLDMVARERGLRPLFRTIWNVLPQD
ncbi:FdhE protein [Paucidesulfovibrio gracilis DSM 16080]|uniref:FdhE protein n=1 Tax=Paucidesulfovibrio gracilis DSM 16080 TaxID=1121449 RepID=A0A1T4WXD2_9BACT|nr:formate dehydrogenase accessory protein FdhE [Paucidesulfovibrio gracilis]SKA81879.1 FdhE protein [Paucidesulfovibrio gracilis DSM 16080]